MAACAVSCPVPCALSQRDSIGDDASLHAGIVCSGNFYNRRNDVCVAPMSFSLEADSLKSHTGEFFSFTFHDFIRTSFGRLCCEDLFYTIVTPRVEN